MTPIVEFYLGTRPDFRGRWLADIWRLDDTRLEMLHNYIQVLFPTREESLFNAWAPVLDDATITAFRQDERLRHNLATSFERMLRFFGLASDPQSGKVVRAADFAQQARNWIDPYNHNYRRITRILKSLTDLGLPDRARAFLGCLEDIYAGHAEDIGEETLAYWRNAVAPPEPEEAPSALPLRVLEETFAVCRLDADAPFPDWAGGELVSLTRTAEELSVVCPERVVPEGVCREGGWRCLQVAGTLDFATVGVLASLVGPLSRAGISVFVLSTFDTDYLMVKEENLAHALDELEQSGHRIGERRDSRPPERTPPVD
jgi:hypothetical protein